MGTTLTATRTITGEDIAACGRLTGDLGSHHVSGLAGRQMAQGLLTVGVAPLFGRPGVHMSEVSLTFLAPVFADDTVTAVVEVTGAADIGDDRVALSCSVSVKNAEGAEVLRGTGVAQMSAKEANSEFGALSVESR